MSQLGTYFLFKLNAAELTDDGSVRLQSFIGKRDRIVLVHDGEEIDISHLCSGWSARSSVKDIRTGTLEISFPRIVEAGGSA